MRLVAFVRFLPFPVRYSLGRGVVEKPPESGFIRLRIGLVAASTSAHATLLFARSTGTISIEDIATTGE